MTVLELEGFWYLEKRGRQERREGGGGGEGERRDKRMNLHNNGLLGAAGTLGVLFSKPENLGLNDRIFAENGHAISSIFVISHFSK